MNYCSIGLLGQPLYKRGRVCMVNFASRVWLSSGQAVQGVTSNSMLIPLWQTVTFFCIFPAGLFSAHHIILSQYYCMHAMQLACVLSTRYTVHQCVSFVVNMPRNHGKHSQNRKAKLTDPSLLWRGWPMRLVLIIVLILLSMISDSATIKCMFDHHWSWLTSAGNT